FGQPVNARRVATETGKYVEQVFVDRGVAEPAKYEPCLRVAPAELRHRINPLYATATEKDDAVWRRLWIWRRERKSACRRNWEREGYRCESANDQSARCCCCQPGHPSWPAQHCPYSCNRADQNKGICRGGKYPKYFGNVVSHRSIPLLGADPDVSSILMHHSSEIFAGNFGQRRCCQEICRPPLVLSPACRPVRPSYFVTHG